MKLLSGEFVITCPEKESKFDFEMKEPVHNFQVFEYVAILYIF
jgi:hypothetical protein